MADGDKPLPTAVGETQSLRGFFTQARYLRMQPAQELERRLGFRPGRLKEGFWVMFLLKKPEVNEFEYRGMTHMSRGVYEGHLLKNKNAPNAEQMLQAGGHNLFGTDAQEVGSKQRTIEDTFAVVGHLRLAKVRPVALELLGQTDTEYPPGSGIPQWTLTKPLLWKAAAFVEPGGVYSGNYQ